MMPGENTPIGSLTVYLIYVKCDTFIKKGRRLRSQELNGSDILG
jgi:hypothetical protein